MNAITAVMASVLAGLFTAAWGAYKDAPLEGFSHRSFWRSPAFSVAILVVMIAIPPLRESLAGIGMFRLFFVLMGVERLLIEIYKPCFRYEDQGKYLIPQDMSFAGLHVANPGVKVAVGFALIAGLLGVLTLDLRIASFPAHLAVACITGLVICIGGAAKDAPFEGFQWSKFPRSLLVLAAVSPLLYHLGPMPLGLLAFACGGVERLLVESYKTYFTGKPPGKFRRDLVPRDSAFTRVRPLMPVTAAAIMTTLVALYVAG